MSWLSSELYLPSHLDTFPRDYYLNIFSLCDKFLQGYTSFQLLLGDARERANLPKQAGFMIYFANRILHKQSQVGKHRQEDAISLPALGYIESSRPARAT
jgi:hypothetical protein